MEEIPDRRIMSLVHSCEGLDVVEREKFLDLECGDNRVLRDSVDQIIHQNHGGGGSAVPEDVGAALPDHYRIVGRIGRGGMGEVFLAVDKRLNRRVAIKFLNSELRADPDRLRRFNQEARSASALNHPNILTIHDIGEETGAQYIVSEYVDGETLGSLIARGRLPITKAIDVAIQMASALAAAHRAGIVHRDLKPENVMIRRDGSVKILDFGLAKDTGNSFTETEEFDSDALTAVSTSPGLILGTPKYMSPEQARGAHLDGRTDIFSLGIILFEMVTGRRPFEGASVADTIANIIAKEPRQLTEFVDDPPESLVRIISRALQKERSERYATMEQLLFDLENVSHELLFSSRSSGARTLVQGSAAKTERTAKDGRSRWAWLLVIPAAVLLIAAGLWLPARFRGETPAGSPLATVAITSWNSGIGELVAASSFSPDGKMVAFASARSGGTEIWAKPTVGGDAIQVTKGGFYNQYPIWSPNGEEIAFFSSRGENRGIWRAAFTGGEQSQIVAGVAPFARPIRWTADGKIYFQEGAELFTVDAKTGTRMQVSDLASKGIKPRTIAVAEDGTTIAVSVREDDLWKVKIEDNDKQFHDVASSREQIDNLAFGPGGKTIYYSASSGGIYQIFKNGDSPDAAVQLSTGNSDLYVQDVSADGARILYGTVNETSDLWEIDTVEQKVTPVANDVPSEYWADISSDKKSVVYQSVTQTDRPFGGSINVKPLLADGKPTTISQSGFSPVWSPNGEWIAFFKRDERGISIWRSRPTGDDAARIAEGAIAAPGYTVTPYLKVGTHHLSWSPDGSGVAYSSRADGMSNIFLAAVDGTGSKMLTHNDIADDVYCCVVWTPDGKSIAFTSELSDASHQVEYRLWLCDVASSRQQIIFASKDRFRFLGFSSGSANAVIAQRSDMRDNSQTPESTDIYSISLKDGSKQKVSTLKNAYFHNIHLSPDGRAIAFVSRRDNLTALWMVPVRGGTPRQLLVENDPKILFSSLSWSPDGHSIVFGKQTRTNLLSMLTR